jgi:hypothetical protein
VVDAASAQDAASAAAVFPASFADTVTGSDNYVPVATYNVTMNETATTSETTAAQANFPALAAEIGVAQDSTTVAASIFNAPVSETAVAADSILALAVLFATMTDGAVGVDQITARLLWEIINDSQNASWAQINDAQNPGWSTINNAQPTTWSVVKTQS